MAFRRRFLGRRGFTRRPLRPRRWTGQGITAEDTVAAGVSDVFEIVVPSDYAGGTTAGAVEPGGATLLRIRGTLNVRATVIGGVAFMYIAVAGANETLAAATDASTIISGDMLWTYHLMVPVDTTREVEIDVRSKRKLENDRVVFVITGVAQTITYTANFRALIASAG